MKNKGLIAFLAVSAALATLFLLAWSTLFIRPDTKMTEVKAYKFPRDSAAFRRDQQARGVRQGHTILLYHTDTVTGKGYQVYDTTEIK